MINILDNQYFGSIVYYKILFNNEYIELEQYERHQKSGFNNRCYIAGANGLISLNIPLIDGRNQKTLAKDVKIDNRQKWQIKHWRALESSYRRSPWFEFYREDLKAFYEKEYTLLFKWNEDLLLYILSKLEWKGEISLTTEFKENYPDSTHIDSRNSITPRNYLEFSCFKYTQVFEEKLGFLQNLSIIDLLFCSGKAAKGFF